MMNPKMARVLRHRQGPDCWFVRRNDTKTEICKEKGKQRKRTEDMRGVEGNIEGTQ
jgi:hypothetical protein